MHAEAFARGVVLPCWCEIGRAHTHEEWIAAGGPSHTGREDEFSAAVAEAG